MFDKLVAGLVTSYLGKYFENVNKDQVKVSLWSGHVRLRNLRFRKDALRAWDTSLCVKEGFIDELTVAIPWTRLQSEFVVVVVKKVRVVLQQKKDAGYDLEREREEAYERRLYQLKVFDALLRQEEGNDEETHVTLFGSNPVPSEGTEREVNVDAQKDATFSARLKASILNNVQLKLEDIVVQYEGCCTSRGGGGGGRGVAIGGEPSVGHDYHALAIVLERFQTYACGSNFEPHFTAAKERVLYKKVELEGMRVLLNDVAVSMHAAHTNYDNDNDKKDDPQEGEAVIEEISKLSRPMASASLRKPRSVWRHRIIPPFGAVAHVQYQPVPYRADIPTARIDVHVDGLRAAVGGEQLRMLRALWREVRDGEEYDALRRFRPIGEQQQRPTDNPAAWWHYAIQATLYCVRRRRERGVFVWEAYKRIKAAREEYMELFRRARREQIGVNWLAPLTEEEARRYRELEMDLPIESVKLARRLAYHRARLEQENRYAILKRRRQQQQQQQQQGEEHLEGEPDVVAVGEPVSSVVEGSSWWSWMNFSRIQQASGNVSGTVEEDSPQIRAEIEEMMQLVYAERWTAAQRLAIAKEFGIPENEVEDLADAGNASKQPLLGGLQWQLNLHVHSLGLVLCDNTAASVPFATLAMEGLSASLACAVSRCFEFTLDVEEYIALSHLEEQSYVVSVLRVAKERYALEGDGKAAMSLSLKRVGPCSWTEYGNIVTTAPYELRLQWNPTDFSLDVPFLRASLDFFWASSTALSSASLGTGASRTLEQRRHHTTDAKTQRTVLMMTVEREFLCDWKLQVCGLRVVAAENERHASRVTLRRLEVRNDPARKLEKRCRIQKASSVPPTTDVFGDDPDDWVNYVHACVEGATVECLFNAPHSETFCGGDATSERQCDSIACLPRLEMCFKKSVMLHRSPSVPLLSLSLTMEQPLQCRCSRQSLSVLCTSFSLITDFCHIVTQRVAVAAAAAATTTTTTAEMRDVSLSTSGVSFLAKVCAVDEMYLVEHEPSARSAQERFYRAQAEAPDAADACRRVEVGVGRMIIYHATRPSFPSHFIELQRRHLHVVRDAAEVSVFVEFGGVSHDCRNGVLAAKRLLFDKCGFPPLESMALLEAHVEEWCRQHRGRASEENAVVEEREEEKVRRAYQIVCCASRTRPCRRVNLKCSDEEEAWRLADALELHAVDRHVFAVPPDPTPAEEDDSKEVEKGPCMLAIDVVTPQLTLLLHDETLSPVRYITLSPPHEIVLTAPKFSYVQRNEEREFNISASGLSVLARARSVMQVVAGETADFASEDPSMHVSFRMKHRPYPHAARKYTDITVSKSVQLAFSSELMCVVEMLWDLTGILTNQIFGHVVYPSIPWRNEMEAPAAAEIEDVWRLDRAGGLLQQNLVSIAVEHLIFSFYYPSDGYEMAAASTLSAADVDGGEVKCGATPAAVMEGCKVDVNWSNTNACNKISCVLQRPRMTMLHVPSGEHIQVVQPMLNSTDSDSKSSIPFCPYVSVSFTIHREPPILSASDFIANGGRAGYRYTHHLELSGTHLNMVYWHPQLWDLTEILSRGVISRAATLVWRQPYIAGAVALRWPQVGAPIAPFSWALLHKHIQLSNVELTLPHENVHVPAELWGAVELLCFQDRLAVNSDQHTSGQQHCVRHVSTLTLEGLEIHGLRRKRYSANHSPNTVTIMNRMNFQLEFSYEMFRAGGWKVPRLRRFRVVLPDDAVFCGTTHQIALLIEWLYANYMRFPWTGKFLPKRVSVDPFITACGGGGAESNSWTIDVGYVCLRLRDPPQAVRCVEDAASFTTFERTAIDIAVVVNRLSVELQWEPSGAFSSHTDVGEASVWQISQLAHSRGAFLRHPGEVVDESFRFLWFHHVGTPAASAKTTTTAVAMAEAMEAQQTAGRNGRSDNVARGLLALQIAYGVTVERGEKAVVSRITLNSVDVTLVPSFLYNIRDSIFGLRVRNAFGRMLRWEPRVAGVLPDPPNPRLQDTSTDHGYSLHLLNLTVPHLPRRHQCVVPLFFASILNIEVRASSAKYGEKSVWSMSIDSIVNNGIVVSGSTSENGLKLRPVLVPQFRGQRGGDAEKATKLFYARKREAGGIEGVLASVWIVVPLKKEIFALYRVFSKGEYKQLQWLVTYLEERRAWRIGTLRSSTHGQRLPVRFAIKTSCVVVADHESVVAGSPNLGRGVVYNLGDTTISKDVDGDGEFHIALSAANVKSLQDDTQYVLKPMGVDISGRLQGDGMWEVQIRVDAIAIHVEQSLYELLLYSAVRHFVATEAELLEATAADEEETTILPHLPMGDTLVSAASVVAGSAFSSSRKKVSLRVQIEWDSFTLHVLRDTVGFFVESGEMTALYDSPAPDKTLRDNKNNSNSPKRIHVSLTSVTLGMDDGVHFLNLQPLLSSSTDEASATVGKDQRLSFRLDARNKEEDIHVNFGKAVVFLETNTMLSLLSTLYEPYRRIVLPEYRVLEVKYIDSNVILRERLVLSKRKKVRVVRGRYNHITIDGNGHDIHFIDAGSPLLSLGEGLTLRIINARIHLYGKAIEYYMAAANGSYVVADATHNTIVPCVRDPMGNARSTSSELDPSASDSDSGGELSRIRSAHCSVSGGGPLDTGNEGPQNNGSNRAAAPLAPSGSDRGCDVEDVTRRVLGNAVLLLTVPEVTSESLRTARLAPQPSRSLVLLATMSARVETVRRGSCVEETGTFDLSEFAMRSQYLDAGGCVTDVSPLVSEWEVTLHTHAKGQAKGPLRRSVDVRCSHGIDIRIRYGDVSFCWRAVLQARQALGHIETNVLDDAVGSTEFSSLVAQQFPDEPLENGTTVLSFSLRYISVDVVDDSTNVDIPLFRGRIENLITPTAVKDGSMLKLHVSCTCSIIFYNFTSSSWCPLLEPVFLDIVLRREPNVSLEDVKQRKGSLRAGLHLRAMRVHFSTMMAENLRRIWLLKERLEISLFTRKGRGSNTGNSNSSSQNDKSTALSASKLEFYTYKVTQHVGGKLEIQFAHDDQNRFPPPCVLNTRESLQFNFPRIEGHELPASQHCLLVKYRHKTEIVNVARTGRSLVCLGPDTMGSQMVVDVTVAEGQKLVDFRTNVAFRNELPFAINIGGVGIIEANEVLHVPVECLRRRTLFTPLTGRRCSSACSLGLSYDMLPHLYEQDFLCFCTLDNTEQVESAKFTRASNTSLQQAVFFLLRFGTKSYVGESTLLDSRGTFEAAFFIVNGMGVPMQIGLMYCAKSKRRRPFLDFSDSNYYEHIVTLDIAAEQRCAITQVSPLKDIYVDVFIAQANGEPMGRAWSGKGKRQPPALVHTANKRNRDRSITLHDSRGATIILHIEYTPRVVTIWCPYWIVNHTPHYLQVSDVRKGAQVAGLRNEEGITPGGDAAYLVNSDRIEKLGDKSHLYLRIGRHSSTGLLKWTSWSSQVPIGALQECGVVNCNCTKKVSVSLSYSVRFLGGRTKATRVITLSPRWILENHTDLPLAFRQCRITLEDESNSLLQSVVLAPDNSHIVDFSSEGEAANAIQVKLPDNKEAGIQSCQWSQPLGIDTLGDEAFNLRYETNLKTRPHSGVASSTNLVRNICDADCEQLCVTRAGSDVLMVSCYRRGSIMHVVVSRPQRPPYVVENRTMYTVYVRQRDRPQHMVLYPRTTRGFAWEDANSRPVMELWAAEVPDTRVKPVLINFEPQAVVKRGEQLHQELHLPGGVVLFVRVRGLGRMSYAISVTTEDAIDAFCSLPYFQYFFQLEVDSVHALLSDENEDFILLTVKPVQLSLSQGKEADGGSGDDQVFEFSLRVIQIDDERSCAKQCVVAQLVDAKPSTIRFARKLLRSAPILYIKELLINTNSIEMHLEDSFIFHAMNYWERLRVALGCGSTTTITRTQLGDSSWTSELVLFKKGKYVKDEWKQYVVFMDHLLIEQVTISISLYRSPGAQNDPMWERLGYLSLFIRSVQDARFVWRRIEQRGVYETLWLIGVSYSSYYKHQAFQQMPNVVHVVGLDMMRGFVTDLLQGYFSSAVITNIGRTKVRVKRRAEAHFMDDEKPLENEEEVMVIQSLGEDQTEYLDSGVALFLPHTNGPTNFMETEEVCTPANSTAPNRGSASWGSADDHVLMSSLVRHRANIIELALRSPWSAFCARVNDSELREYGVFAVQRLLRTLEFVNAALLQWQLDDLDSGRGKGRRGGEDGSSAPNASGQCGRCEEIELMRARHFESDSFSVLPHPSSGLITWAEFAHHISWSEFVQICLSSEVRQYAGMVLRSLVGRSKNVMRLDDGEQWILDVEERV
ncbi:hypothetical protein DQ04_01261050 [Trypanosoma grayi]|uniref:hypothetical protein n=1 Tax=Trypanosoma grayi TaxID=71804 RepID=UPI0004F44846|nr:hypothetical protein DQ04_01261050 [Trypanosoma grayi]KEG13024.1 hypothetical protein DQ04_01261050 [Trypanosoma grayi]